VIFTGLPDFLDRLKQERDRRAQVRATQVAIEQANESAQRSDATISSHASTAPATPRSEAGGARSMSNEAA
jgi:hypothetical protein